MHIHLLVPLDIGHNYGHLHCLGALRQLDVNTFASIIKTIIIILQDDEPLFMFTRNSEKKKIHGWSKVCKNSYLIERVEILVGIIHGSVDVLGT